MAEKRYIRLSEDLLSRIAAGEWQVGEALPPEIELSKSSGFSRSTVRLALSRLEKLGMVSRKRKRGTILVSTSPARFLDRQAGSADDLDEFAQNTRLHMLRFHSVAGKELALLHNYSNILQDRWVEYVGYRTWLHADEPISWTCFSFDALYEGVKPLMEEEGKAGKPSFRVIEDAFGIKIDTIDQSIQAISMPEDVARILNLPRGAPGLEVKRLMYRTDGKAIIHAHIIHRADVVEIKTRLNMSTPD